MYLLLKSVTFLETWKDKYLIPTQYFSESCVKNSESRKYERTEAANVLRSVDIS